MLTITPQIPFIKYEPKNEPMNIGPLVSEKKINVKSLDDNYRYKVVIIPHMTLWVS